jgi:hypothetical protein
MHAGISIYLFDARIGKRIRKNRVDPKREAREAHRAGNSVTMAGMM